MKTPALTLSMGPLGSRANVSLVWRLDLGCTPNVGFACNMSYVANESVSVKDMMEIDDTNNTESRHIDSIPTIPTCSIMAKVVKRSSHLCAKNKTQSTHLEEDSRDDVLSGTSFKCDGR